MKGAIDQHGFTIVSSILDATTIDRLGAALEEINERTEASHEGHVYAIRHLLRTVPLVAEVAASAPVRRLVEPILGSGAFPVQAYGWLPVRAVAATIRMKETAA